MRIASSFRGIYLGLSIALTGPIHLTKGDSTEQSVVSGENGLEIRLLNMPPESIDISALKIACRKIVDLAAADKLVLTRVMIFAEHPIVREALADRTFQIKGSPDSTSTLFVPVSHKGNRIIVKREGETKPSYALFSLPAGADVDLAGCIRRQ